MKLSRYFPKVVTLLAVVLHKVTFPELIASLWTVLLLSLNENAPAFTRLLCCIFHCPFSPTFITRGPHLPQAPIKANLVQDFIKVNHHANFCVSILLGSTVRVLIDRHTHTTDSITSTADLGGNNAALIESNAMLPIVSLKLHVPLSIKFMSSFHEGVQMTGSYEP